ncbi:MAG TPA: hypothetical protein VG406_11990 [Isosphaeraceae bacterium]|jgi:hypothetical protein|nr:hypothetical protein [Isosphaeraceae bacterium]
MGLAESQALLARLLVDAALRERFVADPTGVAAAFGLDAEEASGLARASADQVAWFADSLVRKRRGAVAKCLPLTRRALGGDRFDSLFRRHAAAFIPGGVARHRDDAIAFADLLGRVEDIATTWLGDLVRLEAASLRASEPVRRWSQCRLRHRPDAVLRAALDGADPPPRPCPCLIVWFRTTRRGRLRRLVLAPPRWRPRSRG